MLATSVQGLYAVTPDILDTMCLSNMVKSAILGGANVVQYRNKLADNTLLLEQALILKKLCLAYAVPFIVNDHVALALEVNADGVHLGATDGEISQARKALGANKIIGASCYADLHLAEQAVQDGANYVAFGACFASSTKPNAPVANPIVFKNARYLNVPLVAIGGITLQNIATLKVDGADAFAVINALFGAEDITLRAQQFKQVI